MSEKKNPARFIREDIFGCATQYEFAQILKYEQATISRWETGTRRIDRTAQERIRAAAKKQGINWNDSWFFEVPKHPKFALVGADAAA